MSKASTLLTVTSTLRGNSLKLLRLSSGPGGGDDGAGGGGI